MIRILLTLIFALISAPALAYVGPGAGISVLGSLLGILATIVLAIGAIIIWPIRKMMKKKKANAEAGEEAASEPDTTSSNEQP